MSSSKRLVHIRIPEEFHAALSERAEKRGQSLQRVVLEALKSGFQGESVDPAVGMVGVFESRFSSDLHSAIRDELRRSKRIDLMGVYLLDFLAEDGWGCDLLIAAIARKNAEVRMMIQDKDSAAAHWRFADKSKEHGAPEAAGPDSKRQRAYEAERRMAILVEENRDLNARRYSVYPLVRWLLLLDKVMFVEHHCYRYHDSGRPLSPSKLPVLAFNNQSAATARYSEYFESAWQGGIAS